MTTNKALLDNTDGDTQWRFGQPQHERICCFHQHSCMINLSACSAPSTLFKVMLVLVAALHIIITDSEGANETARTSI